MKILVVDTRDAAGTLDPILRWQEDGHKVRWYFPNTPKNFNIGKGLAERIDDWRTSMRWADVVFVTDNTHYLKELDEWRKQGIPIVGASPQSADWELNRTLGQEVFKRNHIPVPPYREFSDYDAAIAYVKKTMQAYVSKPCGDEPDKSLSYVAKSPADLIFMLERWKKLQKLKGKFILQEKVAGCEMAVGGWFGPGGFNEGWCENWEFKKLMNDDKGPATGEQGTVLRYVSKSKLAKLVLEPLEDELDRLNYCGYVDVNCIIDDAGDPWPLEFTMRPGWPTFNIQQALLKGDSAEWLAHLSSGRDVKPWKLSDVALGAVLAIPDYPYSNRPRTELEGIPIYGMKSSMMANLHPCAIMQGVAPTEVNGKIINSPMWVTAGDYVLVASGTGSTISAASRQAYAILEKLEIPNSPFYRTDIGRRLKKQLPSVQAKGYATGLVY